MKTMPQEISVSALFPPQRPPSVVGRAGEGKKKEARAGDLPTRLPSGASADERRQCDNRGAEMIRNKRRICSYR